MPKNIFMCASDLAVITGDNPYKDIEEIILKYWKKHYKNNYLNCVENIEKSNKQIKKEETHYETINRISKENNINIQGELSKCLKTNTIDDLNKNKNIIFEKTLNKLNENQKKEFTDSINRATNTNFGIKFENKGVEMYESLTNNKVIFDRKYHKKELFHIEYDDDIDVWSLGGKIDGISNNITNNTTKILEIKNRVNKLFKCVRNYEKVQCYAYMFLLDIPVIDLAETLKSNQSLMNINTINFDDDYWDNHIETKIEVFVDDFYNFLEDPERQYRLLVN